VRAFWGSEDQDDGARRLFDGIRERMAAVGAFAATRRLASETTGRAVAALDALPPGRWRVHLRALTLAVLQRHA
jgi:hypothetical protein